MLSNKLWPESIEELGKDGSSIRGLVELESGLVGVGAGNRWEFFGSAVDVCE